jgi:hypothetical protein
MFCRIFEAVAAIVDIDFGVLLSAVVRELNSLGFGGHNLGVRDIRRKVRWKLGCIYLQ